MEVPSHASRGLRRTAPPRPHTPRGGSWTSATSAFAALVITMWSVACGQCALTMAVSSLGVRGAAVVADRTTSASSPRSMPRSASSHFPRTDRSMTGCVNARRTGASASVTRWIVWRMNHERTRRRSSRSRPVASGSKSRRRDHRVRYQLLGVWAWRPTR